MPLVLLSLSHMFVLQFLSRWGSVEQLHYLMFIFSLILWYSYETLPTKHIKKFQKLNLRSWNIYYIFFTLVLFHDSITAAHFNILIKTKEPVWNLIILFTFTVCYLLTNYRNEQTRWDQPFAPKLRLQSKSWPTACLISVGSLGVWVWKKTTPQHKHKL